MTPDRVVALELSRLEAAHLASLVAQFEELVSPSVRNGSAAGDPAIARLVPDAYPDDPDAAAEFRALTAGDLLDRRLVDARTVLHALSPGGVPLDPDLLGDEDAIATIEVSLDATQFGAWLRTLAAVRLVLAERLGIRSEDDHDAGDPRFGIYDWLGYRLDGLVAAVDQ